MKAKHNDFEIPTDNPFMNDKLNREPNAVALTNVIRNYQEGFTLAINGAWGTGKTTFIKMWKRYLEKEQGKENGYKTIYFNAWENDLTSDPLVCVLGELRPVIKDFEDSLLETLWKNVPSYFKNKLLPAAIDDCASNLHISKSVDAAKSLANNPIDIYKEELSTYANKKHGINEFKSTLQELVSKESPNKPLIFFIDELDRCRPDFAVKILEVIKHLFSVPGIVFVLSIDKEQLCNSIRGFYGSDLIKADEYLRRFIDIEYELPEPDAKMFCEYMYDYFGFKDFLYSDKRSSDLKNNAKDKDFCIEMAADLERNKKLSLRQIEKIFAHMRLTFLLFGNNDFIFPDLLFILLYLKSYASDLYNGIITCEYKLEELSKKINDIFGEELNRESSGRIPMLINSAIAKLFLFYNNELLRRSLTRDKVCDTSIRSTPRLTFPPYAINVDEFVSSVNYYISNYHVDSYMLSNLTSKIDMVYK